MLDTGEMAREEIAVSSLFLNIIFLIFYNLSAQVFYYTLMNMYFIIECTANYTNEIFFWIDYFA